MHRNLFKSILVPLAAVGFAALIMQACGSTDSGGSSASANGCVPNSTQQCFCDTGTTKVQTCQADGTFSPCPCEGGAGGAGGGGGAGGSGGGITTCGPAGNTEGILCGNGMVDPGEECDDGNCVAADSCSDKCKLPFCGDKIVQANEDCDDGQNEVGDMCPDTCQLPCDGGTMMDDAGNCVPVDPCAGKLIISGFTAMPQPSQWSYMGKLGYEAGTAMCQAIGAAGVCDYEQLKEVLNNQAAHPVDVTKIAMFVTAGMNIGAWVNRTTTETVGGIVSPAGPGGRCNDWTYSTNHLSDGEWVSITNTAGAISSTFNLDPDTVYTATPMGHTQADLQCGGEQRYIPCCFPVCISP